MVLGSCACQSTGHSIHRCEFERIPKYHPARLRRNRTVDVERRCGALCGSAEVLSSNARPYSCLLSLVIQTKDHHSMLLILQTLMLILWLTYDRCSGSSLS